MGTGRVLDDSDTDWGDTDDTVIRWDAPPTDDTVIRWDVSQARAARPRVRYVVSSSAWRTAGRRGLSFSTNIVV